MRRYVPWTVGIVVALMVIIIVLGYVREWEWTGLVKDKAYTKRTLWDWLQLLIIPAALAGVGLWFNRQQREQESQTADRRAQEDALQAYLDQMSDMLIPNNDQPSLSDEHVPDSLKTVARARTLTVLPRLDGDRKARVVQFLYESALIAKDSSLVDLRKADLSGANLRGTNLPTARLCGADLRKADLQEAALQEADLSEANLSGANLSEALVPEAVLREADLSGANLSKTFMWGSNLIQSDLSRSNLKGANLSGADLTGAGLADAELSDADLRGANLNAAHGRVQRYTGTYAFGGKVTVMSPIANEELDQQGTYLDGATMPDGQKYEDWLKDREEHEKER